MNVPSNVLSYVHGQAKKMSVSAPEFVPSSPQKRNEKKVSSPQKRIKDTVSSDDKPWLNSAPSKQNELLTEEFVNNLLYKVTGKEYKIKNLEIYQNAFVHKSFFQYSKNPQETPEDDTEKLSAADQARVDKVMAYRPSYSYERLEFKGDAVIGNVVANYLYDRFEDQAEGFMTKIKTKIVCSKSLARLAFVLGMDRYLLISTHIENIQGRKKPRFMEDVFESFCGALDIDLGHYVVKEFIEKVMQKHIDIPALIRNDDNYKDIILRYFLGNGWSHPTYSTIDEDGPSHQKMFVVGVDDIMLNQQGKIVKIPNKYLGTGMAPTKKEAEQLASKEALKYLRSPGVTEMMNSKLGKN